MWSEPLYNSLLPHPDNPRIVLREDVINGIANQLRESGTFQDKYALHVRPVNNNQDAFGEMVTYQILQGHTRIEAARRAGIETIPVWSEEMDDEQAYMELVLGNQQSDLSNLEIGKHLLQNIYLSKGGRGNEGGLSQYAQQIGKPRQNLGVYKNGAEVYEATKNLNIDVHLFLDKALHLAAIHKAPSSSWPALVSALISSSWSVKEIEKQVTALNELIESIPEWYQIDSGTLRTFQQACTSIVGRFCFQVCFLSERECCKTRAPPLRFQSNLTQRMGGRE